MKTYDPNVGSTAKTLRALAKQLDAPRHVWLMVPSGKITEDTFQKLLDILEPGDTIVDGGNSNFRDSKRRYAEARKRKVSFVDVGVSGGIWGLEVGFCLMVGGDKAPVKRLRPIFDGAGAGERLGARRHLRRRPLHEDGPQRDRVRADAGVRRGLRADAPLGVRARPERDRRDLALRLGRPLLAARAPARGARAARRRARRHRPLRRGLRRGPLDDQRGDQRERAGAGDHARRSSPASPRAARSTSRPRCRPRCGTSSAGTPSRPRRRRRRRATSGELDATTAIRSSRACGSGAAPTRARSSSSARPAT